MYRIATALPIHEHGLKTRVQKGKYQENRKI